ncbi:MAG: nucleotide exchange factor GrpE [Patescibacteria group bacterium]|nr:MAG: nucleotide exchange factor GrpE [Patescibacteria group bacterium]
MTMTGKQKGNKRDAQENEDVTIEAIEEDPAGSIKKLREKLKSCTKEKREYLEGWQRAKADFINAKKGNEARVKELSDFAKEELITDILPAIDSFEMAFADTKTWEAVEKNWRKGIEYIHSQLLAALESNGLKQTDPRGETFNPALHSSVELVKTNTKADDGKVVEVVQKGYELNGKIVRAAKVKVGQYDDTK